MYVSKTFLYWLEATGAMVRKSIRTASYLLYHLCQLISSKRIFRVIWCSRYYENAQQLPQETLHRKIQNVFCTHRILRWICISTSRIEVLARIRAIPRIRLPSRINNSAAKIQFVFLRVSTIPRKHRSLYEASLGSSGLSRLSYSKNPIRQKLGNSESLVLPLRFELPRLRQAAGNRDTATRTNAKG